MGISQALQKFSISLTVPTDNTVLKHFAKLQSLAKVSQKFRCSLLNIWDQTDEAWF